jgi:hypothetical protein
MILDNESLKQYYDPFINFYINNEGSDSFIDNDNANSNFNVNDNDDLSVPVLVKGDDTNTSKNDGKVEDDEEDSTDIIHIEKSIRQEEQNMNNAVSINDNNSDNDNNNDNKEEEMYDENKYAVQLKEAMKPLSNKPTCAYLHVFWSGFCNQYYMFSGVLLLAQEANYTQILVHSLRWKDLFGTNEQLRHDIFFDVVHWNSYYPLLPRFVNYEKDLFSDIDIEDPDDVKPKLAWNITDPIMNATKPFAIGEKRNDAIMKFYDYTKEIDKGRSQRKDSELLMMKGALRPHPAIRNIMTTFKKENQMKNIMVLHARIEPDMQKHTMCKGKKVFNMTDIVQMLYEKYPEPPVSTVLIILNRSILEKEVAKPKNKNEIAIHNLKTLNELIATGLWGGRVKVVEAGSELAKRSEHPIYSKYSSLVGSIINFFLSLEAEIFVGTIVSSYSTAVISYRFFREKKENFFYMPNGLDWVTPPGIKQPPRFAC